MCYDPRPVTTAYPFLYGIRTHPWLEIEDSQTLALDGATTLGRSASANRHAFSHAKVSTRHALIHTQEGGEFWLVDRGSTNGTLLNDERLILPTRLGDGDRINLGHGVALVFRQPLSAEALRSLSILQQTAQHTYEERRWHRQRRLRGILVQSLDSRVPLREQGGGVGWAGGGVFG